MASVGRARSVDTGLTLPVRPRSILPTLAQGPGILWQAATLQSPSITFTFASEVVLNGLMLTTHQENSLRTFRVRANTDLANPDDLESPPLPFHAKHNKLHMFESSQYPWLIPQITRTFYFASPLVTTKVRLDQMEGALNMLLKVEFVGIDTSTKHRFKNPEHSAGTLSRSKYFFCKGQFTIMCRAGMVWF